MACMVIGDAAQVPADCHAVCVARLVALQPGMIVVLNLQTGAIDANVRGSDTDQCPSIQGRLTPFGAFSGVAVAGAWLQPAPHWWRFETRGSWALRSLT